MRYEDYWKMEDGLKMILIILNIVKCKPVKVVN